MVERKPITDEIRSFSHEEIEGPEDDGDSALGKGEIYSEGSDGDPMPPYSSSSAAGNHDHPGSGHGGPPNGMHIRHRDGSHYPSAYTNGTGAGGPAFPPPQPPRTLIPPRPLMDRVQPDGVPPLRGNAVAYNHPVSSAAPPPMRSPPALVNSGRSASPPDIKPFHRSPDGWPPNGPVPGPYPTREAAEMAYARRHRSLDMPPDMHRPSGGPSPGSHPPGQPAPSMPGMMVRPNGPYPHPPPPPGCYDPRAMHGGYPAGPPHMHHRQMMYPHRPPMMMMPGSRMPYMGVPPAMADQVYRKPPHIKKPLNAFMLFMKEQRANVVKECTLKESAAINQILGKKWHGLTKEEQAKYYDMARQERQQHQRMYPNYNPRDAYCGLARSRGRRPRRGDRLENDEITQLKKCRARYGLEHQEKWCKPCRRKKKCIKFTSADDNGSDEDGENGEKKEREQRGTGSDKDSSGKDDDDDDDDYDDGKSILSAHSYEDDDEDIMPHHFNDEEDDYIMPSLQKGGGIAVLANADAEYGMAIFGGAGGGLFPSEPPDMSVMKYPLSSGAVTAAACLTLPLDADLNLDTIPGADMMLKATPSDAPASANEDTNVSKAAMTTTTTGPRQGPDQISNNDGSLLSTANRGSASSAANTEGSAESPVNGSETAPSSGTGQTPKMGAPTAVLSMPG